MSSSELKYTEYSFAVKSANIKRFDNYLLIFQQLIKQKKDIPYKLIWRFQTLITNAQNIGQDKNIEEVNRISEAAAYFFSGKKSYQFNGYKNYVFGDSKVSLPYSLHDICSDVLLDFYNQKRILNNKGAAMRFLYKAITDSINNQANFTKYQKTAIAMFLANEIGLVKPVITDLKIDILVKRGQGDVAKLK